MNTRPASAHGLSELRVLGQEAIAGMDRLRAGLLGDLEDPRAH